MRYAVETLEPRYLLSAAPVVVNNNNLTQSTTGQNADPNATANNQAVAAAVTGIIGQLSYLGQQIDKDSLNTANSTSNPLGQVLPLIGESVAQMNAQDTQPLLGDALFGGNVYGNPNVTVASDIESRLTNLLTTTPNLTSGTLAQDLQNWLNLDVGGSTTAGLFTVADNSTSSELNLGISFTDTWTGQVPINLGAAAQEFNLQLVDEGSANTDASLQITRTVNYSIEANLTQIGTDLTTYNNSSQQPSDASTLASSLQGDFSLHVNSNSFDQQELIDQEQNTTSGYLDEFGVEFGVMGAGSNTNQVDGAYADGATFDFALDSQFQFADTSYTGSQLPSASLSNGSSFYSIDADANQGQVVDANVSNAVFGQATLTIPIEVYDNGTVGQTGTPQNPNDPTYIAGLGGLTGAFTITAQDLYSDDAPLVQASSTELASFARLTPSDIVQMAQETSYLGGEIDSNELTTLLPFLNLSEGDAYDFATALQNAFVNLLQESVITANSAPTDFSAAGGFVVDFTDPSNPNASAVQYTVNLGVDNSRTTMADLVSALQTQLGSSLIVTTTTNSEGQQVLEFIDQNPDTQFTLGSFSGSTFGLSPQTSVSAFSGVGFDATTPDSAFALPAFALESTAGVSLADFNPSSTQGVSFAITLNGGASTTITIPNEIYSSEAALVGAVQQALVNAGLADTTAQNGVLVQGVPATGGDGFALMFYAGNAMVGGTTPIESITISNPGGTSHFSALNIVDGSTVYAPTFTVHVTNPSAPAVTVYLNPNLTNGLLNFAAADQYPSDFVGALQAALNLAGLGNITATVGTNSGDTYIGFQVQSPGTGSGQIEAFTISVPSSATNTPLQAILGSSTISSSVVQTLTSGVVPDFTTIQQFAGLLYDSTLGPGGGKNGIELSAPTFNLGSFGIDGTGSPSFTFPITISVSDLSYLNGNQVLPDLTGETLSFTSPSYDDVSNLASSGAVTVSRSDNLQFDFGINLIADQSESTSGVLTADMPVTELFTDYTLNSSGLLDIETDAGYTYQVTLPATAPNATSSLSDFVTALNAAIANAATPSGATHPLSYYLGPVTTTTDPNTGGDVLVFTTNANTAQELDITVPTVSGVTQSVSNGANATLGFNVGTTNSVGGDVTGGTVTTYALTNPADFTITLPDGSVETLEIDPSQTAGDTTLSGLIASINEAILGTPELRALPLAVTENNIDPTQAATVAKIEAVASGNSIEFVLNPDVYGTNTGTLSWSVSVPATVQVANPNSFAQDLGLNSVSVDTTETVNGLISNTLPATFPAYGSNETDSFQVSIDGAPYVTVTVNFANVTSAATLIAAINHALAATDIQFTNVSGQPSFALSDYLQAGLTNGGTQVIIRLIDNGLQNDYGSGPDAASYPILNNAAMVLTTTAGALYQLGFDPSTSVNASDSAVPQELLFTMQGSNGTIGDIQFTGTAIVHSAAWTATADFGFTAFNITDGYLQENAGLASTLLTSSSMALDTALTDANNDDFTDLGFNAAPVVGSYAVVELEGLSFPASQITGLAFGANPYIVFGYGSDTLTINSAPVAFTGTDITNYALLPAITGTIYGNTNNMQLLTTLDLDSVVHALERVGDFISDETLNGQTGFDTQLIFIIESLDNIDNVGQDFANAVASLLITPPASLEDIPAALAQALQLPPSALTFNLSSTGSNSTASLALNISFNWAETVVETLPLSIDLGTLENDVDPTPFTDQYGNLDTYSAGDLQTFLLNLSTVSSVPSQPISLNLSEMSQLAVNVQIVSATDGQAVTPQTNILPPNNDTSDPVFETKFILSGDSLTGDLPAGTSFLALTDGSVVIDATGQSDAVTSVLALESSDIGTWDSGTNTITGTDEIDGYTITSGDVGSYVLIESQTTGAPSGLYLVSNFTPNATNPQAAGTWTLTPYLSLSAIPTTMRFHVENGSESGQYMGLATSNSTVFSLQLPFVYDTGAATSLVPSTLDVITAATDNVDGSYNATNATFSGSGTDVTIGGYDLNAGNTNGNTLVILDGQTDSSQDGLYTISFSGSGQSAVWTLQRATTPASLTEFIVQNGANAGLVLGSVNNTQFGLMLEPATYSFDLGGEETLPYTVEAATTDDLGSGVTYDSTTGTITSTTDISINDFGTTDPIGGGVTYNFTGIDDVEDLQVGSLVLVKNQTNAYENGVYVVTQLGDASDPFILTRASFADSAAAVKSLGIDVAQGYENAGTRWVQDNQNLTTIGSAGDSLTFVQDTSELYATYGYVNSVEEYIPWVTADYAGQASANLPLDIVAVTSNGTELVISNDLQTPNGEVTIGDLTSFYESLANVTSNSLSDPNSLNNLVVSAAYTDPNDAANDHPTLYYYQFSPFKPLTFNLSLSDYVNGLSDTSSTNPPTSVHFTYVPDLADSYISTNVLTVFQNGFYMGDALDLALFTIQSAVSEALAQEFPLVGTALGGEAEFIENFRAQFTTLVRQNILSNPAFPLEDIREAIVDAAGSLLTNLPGFSATDLENMVQVNVYFGSSDTPTPYDFTNYNDTEFYGQNSTGVYEIVPDSATAITFSFRLEEDFDPAYDTTLNAVDLGDSSIGGTISTDTTSGSSAGGVLLERQFVFNFGFGVDSTAGFFIFNPLDIGSANANSAPTPMVTFGFAALLDGNIGGADPNDGDALSATNNVTTFDQSTYSSNFNGLAVEVSDGRLLSQLDGTPNTDSDYDGYGDTADDYLPSFFIGQADFYVNDLHPVTAAGAVGTVAFLNGQYADLNDLRSVNELGADDSTANSGATSIFSFQINADADIDLSLQSEQDGLQPATQADFVYDKTFGSGVPESLVARFGINFENPEVLGFGDGTLGAEELYDFANSTSSDPTVVAAAQSDFANIATEVSPIWRFANRDAVDGSSLLVANGATGNSFVDYQNLKINILDYLGNVLYSALRTYEEIIAPIRPYITFLTTPIPGTTAFTSGGLVIGDLLGSSFEDFIDAVEAIDSLISPLAILATEDTNGSGWVPASATPIDLSYLFNIGEYLAGKVADKVSEKVKEKYDEYQKGKSEDTENEAEDQQEETEAVQEDTSESSEQNRVKEAESDVSEQGGSEEGEEEEEGGGDKEAEKNGSFSGGLSGGTILLNALDFNSITNLYQGADADLLQVQLPTLSVSYTYTKEFVVEPFPPLHVTLGFTIGLQVNISFGWDTQGFYFNTVDLTTGAPLPLFVISAAFSVGVGLDFGLVDAEATLTFTVTVSFFWNDVSGTGKIHESDIQYLENNHDSLFAVEVTGTLEFDFDITLNIPLLVTTIHITLFSYTWSDTLFDETFDAVTGQMQLGTVVQGSDGQDDVLVLNSGIYAADRLFVNTAAVNEDFTLYNIGAGANGEDILVDFDNQYYQEFDNIKMVIGYAGAGASTLDAGETMAIGSSGQQFTLQGSAGGSSTTKTYYSLTPLNAAVVMFYGSDGDTTLRAGESYNLAWGRSLLEGGTGTGTEDLDASDSIDPVNLIAGAGPAIIHGSIDGGDNIVAGQGPDLLYGSEDDNFYFETGFGNDRIYVTGGDNAVSFSGFTLNYSDETILTAAEEALYLTPTSVAAIATPLTFSFGPLVESAVTGDSTVFFATDPSEIQQITSWTGGVGGDTFDVYYFAPSETLTLRAGATSETNLFNVFFGNPNIVYLPGTANEGAIQIIDNNPQGQDILDVTQTFPETVTEVTDPNNSADDQYENWGVTQRETLDFPTSLTVDYNAPNSTLFLGTLGSNEYQVMNTGTYNVGTIVQLSPLEFESADVVIDVRNTLEFKYNVILTNQQQNSTNNGPVSLTINITNAYPNGISDLIIDTGAVLGVVTTSLAGDVANDNAGDFLGLGTITINLFAGSLKGGGSIDIPEGLLVISALTAIGSATLPFTIIAGELAARTTAETDPNHDNGIFIQSPDSLEIGAAGQVNGLTTAVGNIEVDLTTSGTTLSYYEINAGGNGQNATDGNITLIADHIAPVSGLTANIEETITEPIYAPLVILTPVDKFEVIYEDIDIFGLILSFPVLIFIPFTIQIKEEVIGYQNVEQSASVTLGGTNYPDRITGTGTLTFENSTPGGAIDVGGSGTPTDLFISSAILATIGSGFTDITFGWTIGNGAPNTTGALTIDADTVFTQAATIEFYGSSITADGGVSVEHATNGVSDSALDFITSGALSFSSISTYSADTIFLSAGANLTLEGIFLAQDAPATLGTVDGSITIDNTGSITLGQDLTLSALQAVSNITVQASSITLDDGAQIAASSEVGLTATVGGITQQTSTHRITANILSLSAVSAIDLYVDALEIIAACTGTTNASITLDNNDTSQLLSGLVLVDSFIALNGDITFTNEGDIDLHRGSTVAPNPTNPVIHAGTADTVTLTSTLGGIFGDTTFQSGDYDVEAGALVLDAVTGVTSLVNSQPTTGSPFKAFITEVGTLSATTTGAAAGISIINTGAVVLQTVSTESGLINFYDSADITIEGSVVSNTNSTAGAAILLDDSTLLSGGGSIIVGVSTPSAVTGTINAGSANVTLKADDYIAGGAESSVAGDTVFLTALGVGGAAGDGTLIDLTLAAVAVDAGAEGTGDIDLFTHQSLYLQQVVTQAGNITVTGTHVTNGPAVNLTTLYVDAGSDDVTISTDDGTLEDNTMDTAFTDIIEGETITTTSSGDSILLTDALNYLSATVTGTGTLTDTQTGSFAVHAVTYDGDIHITAGDGINVDADINVDTITAGMNSDVYLTANGGHIRDDNYGTVNDTSTITANRLTLFSEYGTGPDTGIDQPYLTTQVAILDDSTPSTGGPGQALVMNQTGDLLIDSIDLANGGGVDITAGSGHGSTGNITVDSIVTDAADNTMVNLTSSAGYIDQLLVASVQTGLTTAQNLNLYAATGINLLTDVQHLNAFITGSAGDITINNDKSLALGQVLTPDGDFDLTVTGAGSDVTADAGPTLTLSTSPLVTVPCNVEANIIDIVSPGAIAASGQVLAVYADEFDADVTLGGIYVHNYKIHTGSNFFTAGDVHDGDGTVVMTSAGNFLVNDLHIDTDALGNDIDLTTTDGGDVVLNFAGTGLNDAVIGQTPPTYGDFIVHSDGKIGAVDPATALESYLGTAINVVAANVEFYAQTGIGSAPYFAPIFTASTFTASTVTGDIISGNSSASDFTITGLTTGDGDIGFTQSGGGSLHATGLVTLDGNITLTVHNHAHLYLGTIVASGNVTLTMDHVAFLGGPLSINGSGVLDIEPDSPTQYVEINSHTAQTSDEKDNTLEIGKIGFAAFETDFRTILIGNPYNAKLTYAYFDIDNPYLISSTSISQTVFLDEIQQAQAAADQSGEFRLASFYAVIDAMAQEGELTPQDLQDLYDEFQSLGDIENGGYSGSIDDLLYSEDTGAGANDEFGSLEVTQPASPLDAPGALAGAHAAASSAPTGEDNSWVDRAVVAVGSVAAVAVRKSRRFMGLF